MTGVLGSAFHATCALNSIEQTLCHSRHLMQRPLEHQLYGRKPLRRDRCIELPKT